METYSIHKGAQIAPRKARMTLDLTRCERCGRPHAVYRKFKVCRVCFRELAYEGLIPGVTKASW